MFIIYGIIKGNFKTSLNECLTIYNTHQLYEVSSINLFLQKKELSPASATCGKQQSWNLNQIFQLYFFF